MMFSMLYLAAMLQAPSFVSEEVLEPSVVNEVEHALSLAPTNLVLKSEKVSFEGKSAMEKAINLVSSQRSDGRWLLGTNDVSAQAVIELHELLGEEVNTNRFKITHLW